MAKYTKEVKSNVLKQYQEGTPIQLIIQNTDIPRSTIDLSLDKESSTI